MNRPLTRVAVLVVTGAAIGSRMPPGMLSWKWAVAAAALAVMTVLLALPGRRWIGLLLVAVAAAAYYQGYDSRNTTALALPSAVQQSGQTGIGMAAAEAEAELAGTIASPVAVDGDKVSFVLLAHRAAVGGAEPVRLHEKVQVSIRLLHAEEQERASGWGRGDPIVLAGTIQKPGAARNFGGFDYSAYLYRKQIHWQLSVKGLDQTSTGPEADGELRGGGGQSGGEAAEGSDGRTGGGSDAGDEAIAKRQLPLPDWSKVYRWNDDLRSYLGGIMDRAFPDRIDAGYMKSLVLGLTDDMDPDTYQQFSQLGLTHILAISGLHVAVFVGGCMWLLRLFGLTRERILVITMVIVPFYVALTGGSPSAVRAGIMAMIGLYAARRGLWKDALNIISLAAVAMLIWNPYFLYDVSFQLSFLVTVGLIVGVPRFSRLLPVRSQALNSLLSVTVVAQLISFPITVFYFNGVSLLSALANLLLVPFISFAVLPLGTFVLLAGLIYERAAGWIGVVTSYLNDVTFWLVDVGAVHDPLRLVWPKPSLLWVLLYYVLLGAVYAGAAKWKESGKPAFAMAAVAVFMLFLWHGYEPDRFVRDGKVHFIDVGQGDAILVRTPQSRHMLIDGGGTVTFRKPGEEWKERRDPYEVGKKQLVPLLKQRGVHQLDLLVISHQDQDHIGGLQAVVEQIPVRTVVMNGTWKGNAGSRKLFETAMRRGAEIVTLEEGKTVALDRYTELTALTASGPETPVRLAEEQNNESVVLLLNMRNIRFLFTGDMEARQEKLLLEALNRTRGDPPSSPVPVDVLKIAHHGSKTSTTDEWLAFWQPRMSVISVGLKNSYGHPNPGVLERLERSGTMIYRTDRDGEVVFTVNGQGVRVDKKL